MFNKILTSIKSNKFLSITAIILAVIVSYIVIRMFGIVFTVVVTAFFVSMYKAANKNNYKLALKIFASFVVIVGGILFLLLLNHDWPSN